VLAIAGWEEGGHQSELQKLAAELRLPSSVIFLGPQFGEAKAACYRACDAFILPSFSEGLPMVVLEAWSYGKPVLMTPECNLKEGFAAQAALRIQPNVESISEGLKGLFEMSEVERQAMGRRGLALVQDRFVWPRIALQMQDVYNWLVGGGPQPECLLQG
jgi:poly(glycerol-phosphate) alpha-glucosyltransferase